MPAAAVPLAVVSLSGGMDSTTLLGHYADRERGYRVLAVSLDYGQRNVRELDSARAVAAHYDVEHLVVDLRAVGALLTGCSLTDPSVEVPDGHYTADWDTAMKALVVPNRNMIFGSVLIGIAVSRQAQVVALGMHAANHVVCPDCRPEFVTALDHVAAVANEGFNPPAVEAPFIYMSKTDVTRRGSELGAPLHLTWSCYKGGDTQCGVCATCRERQEAFRDAGVPDPTTYADSTPRLGAVTS